MVPPWFEPSTTREEADSKLRTQHTGNFLVRQSSQPGTLALSVKTGGLDVKHFIIVSRDGAVALEDSDQDFDSLVALVSHYSSHSEELPVCLKLNRQNRKTSAPVLARRVDSPYVSMADRRQRTKSTIWVNSPVFSKESEICENRNRDIEVIRSVLDQGTKLEQDSFSSILNDALLTEYAKRNKEVAAKKGEQNKREEKNVVKEKKEEKEEKKEDPVEEEEEYSLPIDEEDQLYEIPEVVSCSAQDRLKPQPSTPSTMERDVPTNILPDPKESRVTEAEIRDGPDTVPGNLFRSRKKNSVAANLYPPRFQTPPVKLAASKSCSNIFEELQLQQQQSLQQQQRKKSFVRKISLNMSIRRNNMQPIRKLSGVMKKLLPIHKAFNSLSNSQENSDSWEFLPDCGISPVYEEIPERKMSDSILQNNNNNIVSRLSKRSGSCDSVYESEFSSNNSSIDRTDRLRKPLKAKVSGEKSEKESEERGKCVTRIMLNAPSSNNLRQERDPSTVYYV